jgi:hypothetical protein
MRHADSEAQAGEPVVTLPNLILLGDFNAKHGMWGYSLVEKNPFGTLLASILEPSDLVIMNASIPTVFTYQGQHGVLDLTILSPALALKCDYQVLKDPMASDHYPILLQLDQVLPKYFSTDRTWSLKRANWPKFQDAMDRNLDNNLINNLNVDISYKNIIEAVNKAAKVSIPLSTGKTRNRRLVYWCREIKEAIAARKKAFKRWSISRCIVDWIEYKRLKALAQRTIREKSKKPLARFLFES